MTLPVVGQRQHFDPTGGAATFATLLVDEVRDFEFFATAVFFDEEEPELLFTRIFCPISSVYGAEMPLSRASSPTLEPVMREILERVSPRLTV